MNGCATLVAADGTFLGVVSSAQHDLNSICNPHGQYGSRHGFYSVRNPHCFYGGRHGIYSPYNPYCVDAPAIVYQGRVVLRVLARNPYHASSYSVPLIDPDFLFGVLLSVGSYARPAATTTQFSGGFSPDEIPDELMEPNEYSYADTQPYFTTGMPSYGQPIQTQLDYSATWFDQGNELSDAQRYEEAIAAYNQAVQIKPQFPEAWYNRGNALSNLQRYEEAITAYNQAVQIKPQFSEAWYNKGNALLNLQRYQEALISYGQAIQIKPNDYEAWNKRGNALLGLNGTKKQSLPLIE